MNYAGHEKLRADVAEVANTMCDLRARLNDMEHRCRFDSDVLVERLTRQTLYRANRLFIDRNLNPQKTKKAPQSGCFFNTPCAPYERKRLLNRMTLIDTGYEWRFFAPFPVKWTQLPL